MSATQLDLLELLEDHADPSPGVVHAIRPNMWAACGWCTCGCQGAKGARYVLRQTSTRGVTCPDCITVMTRQEATA